MKFTARGLRKLSVIKSDVMAYAWKLAKEQAKKDNCTSRECFGWALRLSWAAFRSFASHGGMLRNKAKQNHNEGYVIWGIDDEATVADNFPHVFSRRFVAVRDDNKFFVIAESMAKVKEIVSSAWSVPVHNLARYSFYRGNKTPLYLL